MNKRNRRKAKRRFFLTPDYYDYNLLAVIILLIAFGLVILYSSSSYSAVAKTGDDMAYFKKQTLFAVISLAVTIIASRFLSYRKLIPLSVFIYFGALALMAMVRFSPFGVEHNGARRWLKIGFEFQPSEVAKIGIIVFVPFIICKLGKKYKGIKGMLWPVLAGLAQALVCFTCTENMSTALIIMLIDVLIVFVAHPKTIGFIIALLAGILIAIALVYWAVQNAATGGFRFSRVLVWLHPDQYSSSGGYQVMQGLYAIGSGGLFGKGLGNSTQKLGSLPEAMNDMIFSIVCEELGLFGGVLLLLLFGYLIYRLFFIAQNAPDRYSSLVVTGIMVHIALQVILNVCVVCNLIPNTGVTMPFVSYGGTALVFIMCEMTIALSVSRSIKFKLNDQITDQINKKENHYA